MRIGAAGRGWTEASAGLDYDLADLTEVRRNDTFVFYRVGGAG